MSEYCPDHVSLVERVAKMETNIDILIVQSTTTFKKLDALTERLGRQIPRATVVVITLLSNALIGLIVWMARS